MSIVSKILNISKLLTIVFIVFGFVGVVTGCNVKENTLDINSIKEYDGNAYCVVNNNIPFFSEKAKCCVQAFEYYADLDNLGRCGVAYANICKKLQPTEPRGNIGQIKPSGWHTVKYNEIIEDNYLYNRCHLIGYQLTGENSNEKNLITGTRYLNIEGMLGFENKVAAYVESTSNHVLYRVTPIFEGDNLVASGVQIEAWSVEDKGKGICFNVFCYNVQPGIHIDYLTGDSKIDEIAETTENVKKISNAGTSESTEIENLTSYVLNRNTKKFHYPECLSVSDIKEKNKIDYKGTRESVILMGYEPCKRCKP